MSRTVATIASFPACIYEEGFMLWRQEVSDRMIIGLISDTHDCLPLIERAVRRLNQEQVGLVLHAGDFVAPFVIPKLKDLNAPLIGVFGNNDGDHELLIAKCAEHEGIEIRGRFAVVTVDGLRIALLHGDERDLLEALIEAEAFDVIVHGHTHTAGIMRKGNTLAVNPGEVCGYLTGSSTLGLLDSGTREAEIIRL
ncbi:phosphodiesterase [hydrocarbon metagenome]|uniref:Phosphodiesterase n=1 Tax=hydrocarbon metagenome TaxID=938273 RepID=A0A0W8FJN9_9ZZZZ